MKPEPTLSRGDALRLAGVVLVGMLVVLVVAEILVALGGGEVRYPAPVGPFEVGP